MFCVTGVLFIKSSICYCLSADSIRQKVSIFIAKYFAQLSENKSMDHYELLFKIVYVFANEVCYFHNDISESVMFYLIELGNRTSQLNIHLQQKSNLNLN